MLMVGVLLLALGLSSGVVLVLASFAVLAEPSLVLWGCFPLLCLAGFALVAFQAKPSVVRSISLASSTLLVLLALASIAGLILDAVAPNHAPVNSAAFSFVLVVDAVLGLLGAASFDRAPRPV